MESNKILVIGDIHWRLKLGYSDFVSDNRKEEKKKILDFIINASKDCSKVVLMGDSLHSRNNPSEVIKEFVEFIERFGEKKLYIIAGNHEKKGSGETAIDFLKEVKNKNWNIITNEIFTDANLTFCPYFLKSELEAKNDEEAKKQIIKKLPSEGDILFIHHAISKTIGKNIEDNIFDEPILPKKELESRFKLVVGGHIHTPIKMDKIIIAGSIFNNIAGEKDKLLWKINEEYLTTEQIPLPGRGIYQLENPLPEDINKITKDNIVKVILTQKKIKIEDIRKRLQKFDAYLLLQQYPRERKKMNYGNGESILELPIKKLLELYSKEKNIKLEKLTKGFNLIK